METRRILRKRADRIVAGVASALATYMNIDPIFVRLAFVVLGLLNGAGVLLYVVLWLLLPSEDSVAIDTREQVRENVGEMKTAFETLLDRLRNVLSPENR